MTQGIVITPENWRITVLREAGRVERCHTLPHHGSYNIAQHAFDMSMMLLVLHPDPSANLIKAVLTNKLSRRYMGDMPSPAKQADGELSKRMTQLEIRVNRKLGVDFALSEADRIWLKALDKAESFIWAKDQIMMGNQHANAMLGHLQSWFQHNEIPVQIKTYLETHVWTRTPDEFPK